jgi:hypothetical protein
MVVSGVKRGGMISIGKTLFPHRYADGSKSPANDR